MIKVSFEDVLREASGRLAKRQSDVLSPEWSWYRIGDAYIAAELTPEKDLWVHMAFSTGRKWLKEVADLAVRSGVRRIAFECGMGSGIESIVRYYKGFYTDSGLKYSDGTPIANCIIPVSSARTIHGNA